MNKLQKPKDKEMKKLSLIVSLIIACSSFNAVAAISSSEMIAGQKKAATENVRRLNNQIIQLKALQTKSATSWNNCNPNQPPVPPPQTECVPHCTSRGSTGTCYSYGADYCEQNASCEANCISRGSTGTCYSYGADYCGPWASCSENCTSRGSTGTCYSYGPDICN
jgi:hypothetical protein